MKVYTEPDEGTIFLYIDEITNEMIIEVRKIISKYNDELEYLEEDKYKYFIDASIDSHFEIVKLLKKYGYEITGYG